jgi:hypothetical protein
MSSDGAVSAYLAALAKIRQQAEATPELSLRGPILDLLKALVADAGRKLLIAAEANAEDAGQPDIFLKDGPRLVGFVETKAPGVDIAKLLRTTKQMKRYRESLANWVLTDYYRFIFIREGEVTDKVEIAGPAGIDQLFKIDDETRLRSAFTSFVSYAPPVIRSPRRLATELARRARLLRDGLELVLQKEAPGGELRSVLTFYQQTLMNDLDEAGFADTFAQTIAYGMFLARLRDPDAEFTRELASKGIPPSIPFLRSAMRLLTDDELLPPAIVNLLDDLAALLDNTKVEPIRKEVAAGGLEHDLVIYFYERFLEQYDAGERMNRGVYYTAPELVGFLIRATETILEHQFGLDRGLADESVLLLDPAVGTGTFLLGAAERALEIEAPRGTASQHKLIREHLLPHFYGFELLPAPYAIAHLKLTSFYGQAGYELSDEERVEVYLTNSLELRDADDSQLSILPSVKGIVDEARSAGEIKEKVPVLVIVGNPPYDRTSHNSNPHSDELQRSFYIADGVRLGDRNTGPLQDDYLRFIRWSVWKLLEQEGAPGYGILAFVTNRAYIERKLHRAVRRFLLKRFDEVHIFDLHGDQREWFRDRVDEKVFRDVQAGIALSLFVKRPGESADVASVRYRECFGKREEKLLAARQTSLASEGWEALEPKAPLWLFVPYNVPADYDYWPTVSQLMPQNVIGVQTHRDQLVVASSKSKLRERLKQFADEMVPDAVWEEQNIRTNRDWNLQHARQALRTEEPRNVMRWTYRPFDRRWVAFDQRLIDFTRTQISPHLLARDDNLALVFANGSLPDGPYCFVARSPVPAAALSWRTFGQAYFAPLWMNEPLLGGWRPNLPDGLLDRLTASGIETNAIGLLHYFYAVLNAPGYRVTYADGLRYDFARIPLARNPTLFASLSAAGAELTNLHLLEHPGLGDTMPVLDGNDQSPIENPHFDEIEQPLYLAPNLTATPVTAAAWGYQQGAYRVLRDYLDTRKGQPLTAEEFSEFRLVVSAVTVTLERLGPLDDLVSQAGQDSFTATELGFRQLP